MLPFHIFTLSPCHLVTVSPCPLVVGFLMALAVFTHPIALPLWLALALILAKRKYWRALTPFALPLLIGISLWLLYAVQDWEIFTTQMRGHIGHKTYPVINYVFFLLGGSFWLLQFYIDVPLNAFLWALPLGLAIWKTWQGHWLLPRWLMLLIVVVYVTVSLSAESWYPPIFVPFGYLLCAALLMHISSPLLLRSPAPLLRCLPLLLALLWWVYQASVVTLHWGAVPKVRQEVAEFHKDVSRLLPSNSVLLVASFSPDPTFYLLRHRPDVRVYQLMPRPMVDERALWKLRPRLTHLLVLDVTLAEMPALRGHLAKTWRFDFGGLTDLRRHEGITIVLLKRED